MKIEKIAKSRIETVDFENIVFGSDFTDHMLICQYENKQWEEPKILPYQPLSFSPAAKVFHYGQAIFEGMKAYKDKKGGIWLFRPEDNFNRFNKSAERLAMPAIPKSVFMDGLKELLKLDKDWVIEGEDRSLYIRPFAIATEGTVSASDSNSYLFGVICSPAKPYYTAKKISVKIMDKYTRAANGGVGFAKAAGNYAAQFYPTKLAIKEGFDQVIWTDSNTHEYIEEAGTMNIFFRIGDKFITGPVSDTILDGITRKSIIELIKKRGLSIEERPIKITEIIEAHKKGSLKEIFGTGTAAVVTEVKSFGYKNEMYELPVIEDALAPQLKKELEDIQRNISEDPYGWRVQVV